LTCISPQLIIENMNLFGHKHEKHGKSGTTTTAPQATNVTTTTTTTASNAPATEFQSMVQEAQPMPEHIEKPAILHERIRKEEVEEVQPVIHREHQRTEVHQILQPMYEGQIAEAQILQKQLPPEVLPTVTKGVYTPAPSEQNTTEFLDAERFKVEKTPILMETEKRR